MSCKRLFFFRFAQDALHGGGGPDAVPCKTKLSCMAGGGGQLRGRKSKMIKDIDLRYLP